MLRRQSATERLLLRLFRAFPPDDVIFKEAPGRALSEYEDERALPFGSYFERGPEFFCEKDILDLGCGYGGRAVRFLEIGARSVVGIEVEEEKVCAAREFAEQRGTAAKSRFLVGAGEQLPLPDASFDLVLMNDVLEHVINPRKVIDEIGRVLRRGGRAAIVFPPYYDLISGSHLHGYATSIPGLNLIFSTKVLKSATTALFEEQGVDYRRYLRDVPTDKLWCLNGLTIRRFLQIIHRQSLRIELLRFQGHNDYRFAGYKGLRKLSSFPFIFAARLPWVREAFCNRVCAILRKDD